MNFGIDPNLDPELALALRVSLEEERARQEQAQAAAGGDTAMSDAQPASGIHESISQLLQPWTAQSCLLWCVMCMTTQPRCSDGTCKHCG